MGQPSLLSEIAFPFLKKTDLGKTCILEMFSELFYENFILNIASIELVQF